MWSRIFWITGRQGTEALAFARHKRSLGPFMSGLTPQDGCDDLELADATVRAIAPSDAYPAYARRCGATFRAWCMCDRPLRGDEFTAAYVSEGSTRAGGDLGERSYGLPLLRRSAS